MNFWIGTSGFQYPEWKGKFYPEKMPLSKMLGYYAEHFSTTEVNYTFRSTPSPKTIERWTSSTPASFRYSLKAPQQITHYAKLRDCGDALAAFYAAVEGLGAKLAPVLFQLPPAMGKDAPLLRSFLTLLPKGLRAAFEFRDPSWFDEEIYEVLRQHGAALCVAESDDLETPGVATANFGYLRLRRAEYTEANLNRWARFLREQEEGWGEAYVYFKHEETASGPRFAQKLIHQLDARTR